MLYCSNSILYIVVNICHWIWGACPVIMRRPWYVCVAFMWCTRAILMVHTWYNWLYNNWIYKCLLCYNKHLVDTDCLSHSHLRVVHLRAEPVHVCTWRSLSLEGALFEVFCKFSTRDPLGARAAHVAGTLATCRWFSFGRRQVAPVA